ncbi:ABC transporter [Alteribacter lacisalsi]|uniref:ABC transporter n=1 Tax=Alteribacter lacisalsi TaxID=2045244 RepID=A0A2W0H9L0_9BACI|nr:ATP-binding cassette domain-containing protein [Alteribacter lacisalsi]PYZ97807.1 ABC transporter [Alteribacter lacisalsi]
MHAVELKGVMKRFSNGTELTTVFTEADLTVTKGEIVVVQGGCKTGKTTLLNLIAAMTPANKGSVLVFGTNLLSLRHRPDWRLANIAFITDDMSLNPCLSPLQNLLTGFQEGEKGYEEASLRAADVLSSLGISNRDRGECLEELSRKETFLTSIARVFMSRNPLVLADEPEKVLADEEAHSAMSSLIRFARKNSITVIIASNDRRLSCQADRTLVLKNGNVLSYQNKDPLKQAE